MTAAALRTMALPASSTYPVTTTLLASMLRRLLTWTTSVGKDWSRMPGSSEPWKISQERRFVIFMFGIENIILTFARNHSNISSTCTGAGYNPSSTLYIALHLPVCLTCHHRRQVTTANRFRRHATDGLLLFPHAFKRHDFAFNPMGQK